MTHLRELRHERGMTQAQLAAKAHVSIVTIHSYEHDRRPHREHSTQRKVLRGLGLSWSERGRVWPSDAP